MERRVAEEAALRFRMPLPVTEAARYRSGDIFPVCPQCGCALEREYQAFCDRCGQRLDWEGFEDAVVMQSF